MASVPRAVATVKRDRTAFVPGQQSTQAQPQDLIVLHLIPDRVAHCDPGQDERFPQAVRHFFELAHSPERCSGHPGKPQRLQRLAEPDRISPCATVDERSERLSGALLLLA